MIDIIPSILSKTVEDAQRKLDLCEGVFDKVHLDVMDNTFVKNSTFAVEQLSKLHTHCTIRAHLMVSDPLMYAPILKGKVNTVFFHYESVSNAAQVIDVLHKNFHVGVVLNIDTPARVLFSVLDKIDFVLIMTVKTGFGGGSFHPECLEKVLQLKTLKQDLTVGIDGGVHKDTVSVICKYPVDFVTVGSELFATNDFHQAVLSLKKAFSLK